jgi:hypothetical protein
LRPATTQERAAGAVRRLGAGFCSKSRLGKGASATLARAWAPFMSVEEALLLDLAVAEQCLSRWVASLCAGGGTGLTVRLGGSVSRECQLALVPMLADSSPALLDLCDLRAQVLAHCLVQGLADQFLALSRPTDALGTVQTMLDAFALHVEAALRILGMFGAEVGWCRERTRG